jgi:hypothetical protein
MAQTCFDVLLQNLKQETKAEVVPTLVQVRRGEQPDAIYF